MADFGKPNVNVSLSLSPENFDMLHEALTPRLLAEAEAKLRAGRPVFIGEAQINKTPEDEKPYLLIAPHAKGVISMRFHTLVDLLLYTQPHAAASLEAMSPRSRTPVCPHCGK